MTPEQIETCDLIKQYISQILRENGFESEKVYNAHYIIVRKDGLYLGWFNVIRARNTYSLCIYSGDRKISEDMSGSWDGSFWCDCDIADPNSFTWIADFFKHRTEMVKHHLEMNKIKDEHRFKNGYE